MHRGVSAVGVSAGGFATVALTASAPQGLVAAINFAGGRGSLSADEVCEEDDGWDALLASLPERLPGALSRGQLLAAIIKPPFAECRTAAHRRSPRARAGRLADGTAGVHPVIAYGDANFASSFHGSISAPTTAAVAVIFSELRM